MTTSFSKLSVTFRGKRIEIAFNNIDDQSPQNQFYNTLTVGDVKARIVRDYQLAQEKENTSSSVSPPSSAALQASDIRIILKGKILTELDDHLEISNLLRQAFGAKSHYRLIATGVSADERLQDAVDNSSLSRNRVRDDLSARGREEIKQRQRAGQLLLQKAAARQSRHSHDSYGFGEIEVLPLPDQDQAREILTSLSRDPGVLACMARHKWNVGILGELYPEGNVGESEVCVMGLNTNAGEKIQLRIRTDDLRGFRKILSIREVLYHELAHNVFSEHDGNFFKLMRQIKQECISLDWTKGAGLSEEIIPNADALYTAGTHQLGGVHHNNRAVTVKELAAQAALNRQSQSSSSCGQHSCKHKDDDDKTVDTT